MNKTRLFIIIMIVCNILYLAGIETNIIRPKQALPLLFYKEFPFVLEYEINGEKHSFSDVLICEFDGYKNSMVTWEKPRIWTSYLKKGSNRITLLKTETIEVFYSVNINPNEAGAVYMGDKQIYTDVTNIFPNAWYTKNNGDAYIISSEEMYNKYQIKMLNCTSIKPIENTFIDLKWIIILLTLLECIMLLFFQVRYKRQGAGLR